MQTPYLVGLLLQLPHLPVDVVDLACLVLLRRPHLIDNFLQRRELLLVLALRIVGRPQTHSDLVLQLLLKGLDKRCHLECHRLVALDHIVNLITDVDSNLVELFLQVFKLGLVQKVQRGLEGGKVFLKLGFHIGYKRGKILRRRNLLLNHLLDHGYVWDR